MEACGRGVHKEESAGASGPRGFFGASSGCVACIVFPAVLGHATLPITAQWAGRASPEGGSLKLHGLRFVPCEESQRWP